MWNWCFRAPDFAVFRIDPSRGSQVLLELLGPDYAGTLICDFFSAYRKFLALTPCVLKFCQAHLIRDIAFLETLSHRPGIRWAGKLLELFRKLFRKHHQRLAQPHKSFAKSLDNIRRAILALVARAPAQPEARNIQERLPHVHAGVLHVPRVAAHRPDQQLHRAHPALCGDRPQTHPRHPRHRRTNLVPARLVRAGHLPHSGPFRLPVPRPVHRLRLQTYAHASIIARGAVRSVKGYVLYLNAKL